MHSLIRLLLGHPPPTTSTGVLIPADGTPARLVQLTTTTHSVADNVDAHLRHIPDLRPYWGTGLGWLFRDHKRFRLSGLESCNGPYLIFSSFSPDCLPKNECVPSSLPVQGGACYGEVFIVKLADRETSKNGWAVYEDVKEEFLSLPMMRLQLEEGIVKSGLVVVNDTSVSEVEAPKSGTLRMNLDSCFDEK